MRVVGGARGMRGFWAEVHVKTQVLYQVPNWSYGPKLKKGGKEELGGCGGSGWRSTHKLQVSIKSQSRAIPLLLLLL